MRGRKITAIGTVGICAAVLVASATDCGTPAGATRTAPRHIKADQYRAVCVSGVCERRLL